MTTREQEILEEITYEVHTSDGGWREVSPEALATFLARMEGSKEETKDCKSVLYELRDLLKVPENASITEHTRTFITPPSEERKCEIAPYSSRGCELGTRGCETRHSSTQEEKKDIGTGTLKDSSDFLRAKGYNSLADMLSPTPNVEMEDEPHKTDTEIVDIPTPPDAWELDLNRFWRSHYGLDTYPPIVDWLRTKKKEWWDHGYATGYEACADESVYTHNTTLDEVEKVVEEMKRQEPYTFDTDMCRALDDLFSRIKEMRTK